MQTQVSRCDHRHGDVTICMSTDLSVHPAKYWRSWSETRRVCWCGWYQSSPLGLHCCLTDYTHLWRSLFLFTSLHNWEASNVGVFVSKWSQWAFILLTVYFWVVLASKLWKLMACAIQVYLLSELIFTYTMLMGSVSCSSLSSYFWYWCLQFVSVHSLVNIRTGDFLFPCSFCANLSVFSYLVSSLSFFV